MWLSPRFEGSKQMLQLWNMQIKPADTGQPNCLNSAHAGHPPAGQSHGSKADGTSPAQHYPIGHHLIHLCPSHQGRPVAAQQYNMSVPSSNAQGSLVANHSPGQHIRAGSHLQPGHQMRASAADPQFKGCTHPSPPGQARVLLRPKAPAALPQPGMDLSTGCLHLQAIGKPVQMGGDAGPTSMAIGKQIKKLSGQKRIAEQAPQLTPAVKQPKLVKVLDRPKPDHYPSVATWSQTSLTFRLQLLALAEPDLWNPATAISVRTLEEVDASLAIGFNLWRHSRIPVRQPVQSHRLDLLQEYRAKGCPLKGKAMEDIVTKYHQLLKAPGSVTRPLH